MNRHGRYALLTPLLASALAMPPAMAAQAAPADELGVALAAPFNPSCKLVKAPDAPGEFDLVLAGFKPRQEVRISGPEKFTRQVNKQGSFTEQDVKKGTYTATVQVKKKKVSVPCTKPPRSPAVDITEASANLVSPGRSQSVDCRRRQRATFGGTLTGKGTGSVKYVWTSSDGKRAERTLNFTGPTATVEQFSVTIPAREKRSDPRPRVTVQLRVPKQQGQEGVSSSNVTLVLKCRFPS